MPDRDMPEDEIDTWFADLMDMEIPVNPSEVSIAGSPAQCAERFKAYMDAGRDHFVLDFARHGLEGAETTIGQMTDFVEHVVPLLE